MGAERKLAINPSAALGSVGTLTLPILAFEGVVVKTGIPWKPTASLHRLCSRDMNLAHPTPRAEEANDRPETDPLSGAFARWQGELLGTLYHLVGNVEDARDALQETFLKCWRHRDEVGGVENLKAWIFRIALNTGRDLRGAALRRRRVPLP